MRLCVDALRGARPVRHDSVFPYTNTRTMFRSFPGSSEADPPWMELFQMQLHPAANTAPSVGVALFGIDLPECTHPQSITSGVKNCYDVQRVWGSTYESLSI